MININDIRPVIIAMAVYIMLSHLLPKVLTKPTKIQVVDDVVEYSAVQRKSLIPGAIMAGIVVYLTMLINQRM